MFDCQLGSILEQFEASPSATPSFTVFIDTGTEPPGKIAKLIASLDNPRPPDMEPPLKKKPKASLKALQTNDLYSSDPKT